MEKKNGNGIWSFVWENSGFLIAGAIVALVWANAHHESYEAVWHTPLASVANGEAVEERHDEEHSEHGLSMHFIVNDILMALFFAIAAKEVREAMLPGGDLSKFRTAAMPVMATIGGMVGPLGLFLLGALLLGQMETLGRGWAIPCATDIAFSVMVARLIFGRGHPAIAFLLLLAIVDDAGGLLILAIAYPQGDMNLLWLSLTVGAMSLGWVFHKKLNLHSFWWYLLIPGVLSWLSFYKAGLHPALGLVPIIPVMPHAKTDLGIFAKEELNRHDTLNEFEHWWKNPVELIIGVFALANAGVVLSQFGEGTWLVLAGLIIGKPVGIVFFTWIGKRIGLEIPGGMGYGHILTIGAIAGIGFTVALFVATAAFPQPGPVQDAAKMGALLSFIAAGVAVGISVLTGVFRKPMITISTEENEEAA